MNKIIPFTHGEGAHWASAWSYISIMSTHGNLVNPKWTLKYGIFEKIEILEN